jgi:hypothetical protein
MREVATPMRLSQMLIVVVAVSSLAIELCCDAHSSTTSGESGF